MQWKIKKLSMHYMLKMMTIVTTFNLIWHILKINTLCVTYVILVMDQSSQIKEQRKKDKLFKIHTTLPLQPLNSYLDVLSKNLMFKDDSRKSDLRLHLLFVLCPTLLLSVSRNVRSIVHGWIWLLHRSYSFL